MRKKPKHTAAPAPTPKPPSRLEKFAGIFMSLAAAVGFGVGGAMSLWDHSVTLPGRNGPVHNTGAAADVLGWVLLAAAAAFASHLAMLVKPGRTGVRWMAGIFLVWAAAAVSYYAIKPF